MAGFDREAVTHERRLEPLTNRAYAGRVAKSKADPDPNAALRAEYEAALAALEPQIRGLIDLIKTATSAELQTSLQAELDQLKERRKLLNNGIAALDEITAAQEALAADGYPAVPMAVLSAPTLEELNAEVKDIEAAQALFEAGAEKIEIHLGVPTDKP